MLYFVGTGVSGHRSIPAEGMEVIRGADVVYLERFTSPVDDGEIARIREQAGGEFRIAKRWMVEDGGEILREARGRTVALLSYGDPYVATTHQELRTRAVTEGIGTRTVHGASAVTSAVGECGLHHYKVGRVATVMSDPKSSTTPYRVTCRNLEEGSHTVLLLEYDEEGGFFLGPGAALRLLRGADAGEGRNAVGPDTFAIVASRVGSGDQRIVSGPARVLEGADFGAPPHTVIIPGRMHFTESDAVRALSECAGDPSSNSDAVRGVPAQMIEKYVPMVREALREVAAHYEGSSEFGPVLENAELYVRDAEQFLREGKGEVAVLSIGYADGLVDALRMAKGMDPKM